MKALLALVGLAALIIVAGMALGFININQTETVSLPQVKVEGGTLPKFDASVAKVEVGTENRTVEVPTVGTTDRTVEVPTVDIVRPGERK